MEKILITYEQMISGETLIKDELVLAAGMFDGMHPGHQALIREAKKISSEKNAKLAILSVNRKPRTETSFQGRVLMTEEEKEKYFNENDVDYFIILDLTSEILRMSPEEFIAQLTKSLAVLTYIVGFDYRFGQGGSGTVQELKQLSQSYNFETKIIEEVKGNTTQVSSSYIKDQILSGNIEKANELLGTPYTISGEVVHGEKKGRLLGFPTINMKDEGIYVLPPLGVYATRVYIDSKSYIGLTNIGYSPTVKHDSPLLIETNILDFTGDLYGEKIDLSFYKKIRDEQLFNSIDELIEQMNQDKKDIKHFFE